MLAALTFSKFAEEMAEEGTLKDRAMEALRNFGSAVKDSRSAKAGLLIGKGSSLAVALDMVSDERDPSLFNKVLESAKAEGTKVHLLDKNVAAYVNKPLSYQGITAKKGDVLLGGLLQKAAPLAHELGHGEIGRHRWGKLLQNRATHAAGRLGTNPLLAAGVGALTARSDDERVQTAGRWAPVAAAAPLLAYEALASIRGARRLRRLGATDEQISSALVSFAPAWGTYAGKALLSSAAASIGSELAKRD